MPTRIDRLVWVVIEIAPGQRTSSVIPRSGSAVQRLELDRICKDVGLPCNICLLRVGHYPLSRAAWSWDLGPMRPLGTELQGTPLFVSMLTRCNSRAGQYRIGCCLRLLVLVIVVVVSAVVSSSPSSSSSESSTTSIGV